MRLTFFAALTAAVSAIDIESLTDINETAMEELDAMQDLGLDLSLDLDQLNEADYLQEAIDDEALTQEFLEAW